MQFYYFALYFFVYGFAGWCTEVGYAATQQGKFVNRGFLNGPICPVYGIGVGMVVQFLTPVEDHLILLYLASTLLVTLIEGITGYLMDKIFHHKWWDYSNIPFNIGGYVCLRFSLIWGVACVVIVKGIHPLIHRVLSFLPVLLGAILVVILGIILFADLYVTASGILKMNRRLEAMEKIAAELRELSDKVGENIYENVMDTMEFHEEKKEQLDQVTEELRNDMRERVEEQKARIDEIKERAEEQKARADAQRVQYMEEQKVRIDEMKARMDELKSRYEEMAENRTKVGERLVKAFPGMQSRLHHEILEELKERVKNSRK